MVRTMKTNMVFCSCGSEAIGIDYDQDDNLTSLAFWQLGDGSYKIGWKDKFRWIKQILKGNRPYTDMVMLNAAERAALINALKEHTPPIDYHTLITRNNLEIV